ncbi:MAG: pyridoxamine 5'-phosphate oxidase family protein [Dehalococcoidia bacterium]|nr:MAG: pyridoxamine 5'-phosphate oxidase family protein [Dehalococcoidia bacterium]
MNNTDRYKLIHKILTKQKFTVLATDNEQKPYANLVAFVLIDDLENIVFATNRNTQKYSNIITNPNVALLFDSRTNDSSDLSSAIAISALGLATITNEEEKCKLVPSFVKKHPNLNRFIKSKKTAIIKVSISEYFIARFRSVERIQIKTA